MSGGARWKLASLVLLVIAVAAGCLVWAVPRLEPVPWPYPVVMGLLVAVAGSGTAFMRVRSQHLITTVGPAILATVVVLPGPWAVVATAAWQSMWFGVR